MKNPTRPDTRMLKPDPTRNPRKVYPLMPYFSANCEESINRNQKGFLCHFVQLLIGKELKGINWHDSGGEADKRDKSLH